MLDLGARGRTLFCAVFFGVELLLIATAGTRSDRSYAFRMFPEVSTITVHLSRRLDGGRVVPVEGGRWQAHDCSSKGRSFQWAAMVRPPAPASLDMPVGAPYGVESEVERTRDAMRWVAEHTPDDCETRAFVARIEASRNGRALEPVDVEVARAPHAR
jgi:hypothetical protein